MSEDRKVVFPNPIDDVLINPGIGFMTFQRFNGDEHNPGKGWTEGFPIEYQEFKGTLENKDHPMTTIAYHRIYWRFLEPEKGHYRWDLIDKALETAKSRGQTLMLRVAPFGTREGTDVPDWYRAIVGDAETYSHETWVVDHNDPRYVQHFGEFIRKFGERYNGHPNVESVDLSLIGPWGEGAGFEHLSDEAHKGLADAYLDTFTDVPLLQLIIDDRSYQYALSKGINIGWRADCLGDMGPWEHMREIYPLSIIRHGLEDAWKKAPVSFEVCWVVKHWYDMGWDIDYIIDQSLKWHISSFNSKSSPMPKEWLPNVDRWLKKMGYRLALRRFSYPAKAEQGGKVDYECWWENMGVAPCYKKFLFAFRLKGENYSKVIPTDAKIIEWLPGDSLYDNSFVIPQDAPKGTYDIQVGLVDIKNYEPRVKLAMEGLQTDGWYNVGKIEIV